MNDHPKVDFPTRNSVKFINILSVLSILGTLIYVIVVYPTLPDTIPSHFNALGEADGWGGKNSIFIMPFVAIVLFIPLYFISKVPHTFNLPVTITEENAPRIYPVAQFYLCLLNLETVLLLCYLVFESIPNGWSVEIFLIPIMIAMFALTFIFFIIKVKRLK